MSEKESKPSERLLPSANVSLIMKKALPTDDFKISQKAKECVQDFVTEFIGFVTCEASDRLTMDKRRTISGDDILDSMRALGFEKYVMPLAETLRDYRKTNNPKKKKEAIEASQQQQQNQQQSQSKASSSKPQKKKVKR